jgi:threonine dehydrogenase-like Zn-dependent dehydrogenase
LKVIITGGTKSAYTGTLKFLRNGGTVVGIGLPPKETAFFGGYAEEIIRNRLTVTGMVVAYHLILAYCTEDAILQARL